MKANDSKSRYRILVVKDRSKQFQTALQNAVNLAKKIGGSIDLLHVKSPYQVIRDDNQLAAWRELHQESGNAKMSMKEIIDLIATTEEIPVTYNFTFGNLINEVKQHIKATRPDIVVLGKQKTGLTDLIRVDLTSYLLKNYQGALLISRGEKALRAHDDIALGLLDDFLVKGKSKLSEDLEKSTAKPITLLKIKGPANETAASLEEGALNTNMTTFEFDHGDNISNSVSKYIERSGVNLLCVRRSKLMDLDKKIRSVTRQIQKTIQKTNTPVLVLES